MKRNRILILAIAIFAVCLTTFLTIRYRSHKNQVVEKSVEKLFDERALAAKSELETPLGQLVLSKNWAEFKKQFDSSKNGALLAKITRALFIHGKIDELSVDEQALLLNSLLDSLSVPDLQKNDNMNFGLILSQVERLPGPKRDSDAETRLIHWLKSETPGSSKFLLASKKLVAQPSSPKPELVHFYLGHLNGKNKNLDASAVYLLDEIRNPKTRKGVLTELLALYPKLPTPLKPAALVVLARNISQTPESIKRVRAITIQSLRTGSIAEIESALRALLPLHQAKPFTPVDCGKIVNWLTAIPAEKRTPFVAAKSEEIIKILQP